MKKVAIVGGGISGLYLANILNNYSEFDFKIYEKRDNFDFEDGYGIQLSVNSIRLLNNIGFKNLPSSDICFPSKVNFFQAKNLNKICDIDLTQFNEGLNRYSTLKRSTLLKFLLNNIPKDKIKFNMSLKNLKNNEKIEINFSDDTQENFDFLVIADGAFSESRLLVSKDAIGPKYNNSVALRGLLNEYNDKDVSIFMGSNFHYVIYPINQRNVYNFVAILKKKLTNTELDNQDNFQSEVFMSSLIEILNKNSIIKLNNLSKVKTFPIFTSDNIPTITKKNIFLTGDALFTFPPSFAQGASQSIETAKDIFDSMNNQSNNLYKKRISKISSINWRSKLNHFAFQLSEPFSIFIRNIILRYLVKNKKFLKNYLGKIYRN